MMLNSETSRDGDLDSANSGDRDIDSRANDLDSAANSVRDDCEVQSTGACNNGDCLDSEEAIFETNYESCSLINVEHEATDEKQPMNFLN